MSRQDESAAHALLLQWKADHLEQGDGAKETLERVSELRAAALRMQEQIQKQESE